MSFGLTNEGFKKKRLADIKPEIEASLKSVFGDSISLIPQSVFGQIVGILSEREALLWEQSENIYNSFYPSTSFGNSLSELVLLNGIERQSEETDPELRVRREKSVGALGDNLVDSLYGQLLNLDNVIDALVKDNKTKITDANGIPPNQFLCVVDGGLNEDIAKTIWINTPQGIDSFGDIVEPVIDAQGDTQEVKFKRPSEIDIYITVDVTTNSTFPVDGDDLIKNDLVSYGDENFKLSDDIIQSRLFTPVNRTEGIIDIEIFIGTSASPTLTNNIPIALAEIGKFDINRIVVNVS